MNISTLNTASFRPNRLWMAGTLAFSAIASNADATTIGFFSTSTSAALFTNAQQAVTRAGSSYVKLGGLTAENLAAVDVAWIMNGSNTAALPALQTNAAAVASFVEQGGVLLFHDRYVSDINAYLPGGSGIGSYRDTANDNDNVNILDKSTIVTNGAGPGGLLKNFTLDGGNSSSHGAAYGNTLPEGTTKILTRSNPNEIVDFTYAYGAGDVYYSSIPLDYYLSVSDVGPLGFKRVYAPNVLAFTAQLAEGNGIAPTFAATAFAPVPVPAASWLFASAFGAIGWAARRRSPRV